MALDQNRAGDSADRNRARKEERLSGNDIFWLPNVRDDVLGGLPRARANTGEGDLVFLAICTPRFRAEAYSNVEGDDVISRR